MEVWKSIWDRLPKVMNYVFILLVVFLLSLLFPNTLRFKYTYEIGRAWTYEDLYAPFDFAIPKTTAQYQQERKELEKQTGVYYRKQDSIGIKQLQLLKQGFKVQFEALEPDQFIDVQRDSQKYQKFAAELLSSLYRRGIIRLDSGHDDPNVRADIRVVSGNTLQQTAERTWLTQQEAVDLLRDSLPLCGLPEPEFLFPILTEAILPNIWFDRALNAKLRTDLIESISPYQGMVQKNELIVPRGGVVTESVYQMLEGYREQYTQGAQQQESRLLLFLGYFLMTVLIIGTFMVYLYTAHPFVFRHFNHLVFILSWPLVFGYLVYLIRVESILSPYMLPFAVVPIVVKNFYDNRLALYVHIIVVLIGSLLSSMGFSFFFLQLVIGLVVVIPRVESLGWNRFFDVILIVFIGYSAGYFALALTEGGALDQIDWDIFYWLLLSSLLLLSAYPLTTIFERIFGFTSVLRLKELADTNRPLLQLLATQAPGTFQHSLQVANLAEVVARSIGADHLLVKVAALYHDIGKLKQPEYFIENQLGENLHDALPPRESAQIIIGHVTEGLVLARKYKLPRVVADFIRTHHGTTRVEYFYRQLLKTDSEAAIQEEASFRYPGPKPLSKEATILMMADSIEAACRSMKTPGTTEIDEMIDRLVGQKMSAGQFEESALTFSELEVCKQTFRQMLRSMYHLRVEYPK